MWVAGRTLLSEGLNVWLGCFSPVCPCRGPFCLLPSTNSLSLSLSIWCRRCPLTKPPRTHPAQGVSRPWPSTFAHVPLRLPPSSRITSLCRRRGHILTQVPVACTGILLNVDMPK
ncbi:hypothetical protein V8D89_008969 [Ganoderma adspersum]